MRFLQQFNNVLVYVLLAAGFIKLMMSLWLDASIILGVVIINGLLGFLQEGRAEKSLDSIRNMLSAEARTLRNGQTSMIPAETLVPGDIVFLESGDKIPADIRLVEVKNLRTEEAALTGESVPSDKSTAPVSDKATVGDRAGMAYSGTLVVSGRASGVVVATGSQTELGRINQIARRRQRARDPAPAPDQEVRLCDHGHHSDRRRDHLRLRTSRPRYSVRRNVPGGDRHRGVDDPGRLAGPHHHHARDRRPADGGPQRDRAASAGGRNAGLRRAHLLGQDRHADAHGNDGRVRRDRGRHAQSHRRRLRQRGPGAEGRRARRQEPDARASGRASRRSATIPSCARRTACGRSRAIRPRARSIRSPRNSEWIGRRSRPPIRASTPSRSNPNTGSWRRCTRPRKAARSCSSKARPRRSSTHCDRQQDAAGATAARSRLFRKSVRRSRGRRASGCWRSRGCPIPASRPAASARPICRRTSCCSASSASSIRRARKRSKR